MVGYDEALSEPEYVAEPLHSFIDIWIGEFRNYNGSRHGTICQHKLFGIQAT